MELGAVRLGGLSVSRMIIGGNPFSGFAHQTPERDIEMQRWYTMARIKEALRQAEKLGINAHIGRADNHIMRMLMEYWDEGGKIRWIAQTCPGVGPIEVGIRTAIQGRASACYIHGGVMDNLFANGKLDEVPSAIRRIKDAGMPAGIACHNPAVLGWAERNIDVDFYMCSYYNPSDRSKNPASASGHGEVFLSEHRDRMVEVIAGLSRPAIHYKVLAAGRNDPREAFDFVAEHLRPQDAVCVGVYTKDKPDMLAEDIRLLADALRARGKL